MAKRRASGTGSIYRNDQKGLWVAEVNLPNGKRRRKTSKTQSVVKEWLRVTLNQVAEGTLPAQGKYTIAELFDRWLKDVGAHTLRPKTFERYSSVVRLHIKPELGNVRVSSLRPDQLQTLYARKLESGLSKRSVELLHAVIHRVLETALKWNLIIRNPADAVTPPRPDRIEIVPLNQDQVRAFIEATKDDRLFPLWLVLLGCGLRRGEALALTVADIDIVNRMIHVRHNLQWLSKIGFVVGEPKTEKGRRDVGIPDFVAKELVPLLKVKSPGDYVFTTSRGTPFEPRNIVTYFKRALDRAGLPNEIRLHDLRHTFVSYLLSQNVPLKDVQEIVGHSSIVLTADTYAHLLPGAQRNAADKANGMFKVGEQVG